MLQSEERQPVADQEALFDRYCPVIFAYLRSHLSSREEAEDLTLDVFAAALENPSLPEWSGERQLAWLKRVARNKLMNFYRYARRRPTVALDESVETLLDPDEPERIFLRNEMYGQLHQAIQQLSPQQQQLLLLRYGHGLATAEIAMLGHNIILLLTLKNGQWVETRINQPPVKGGVVGYSFSSVQTGPALGAGAHHSFDVYRTSNGGTTWQKIGTFP